MVPSSSPHQHSRLPHKTQAPQGATLTLRQDVLRLLQRKIAERDGRYVRRRRMPPHRCCPRHYVRVGFFLCTDPRK